MSRITWGETLQDWSLRCPACRATALAVDETRAAACITCARCHASFAVEGGVAGLLDPAARPELHAFLRTYQDIRRAEGYTDRGAAYYQSLPEHPRAAPDSEIWRIRRKSFAAFKRILSHSLPKRGQVLDLGSGNGWLCHHLAALGYRPMGMDINTDPDDGLRAVRHYPLAWPAVQSSFDQLPLDACAVDMVVFNGSLHYSADVATTLAEALRVLRPGGSLVIMDTPIYTDPGSGVAMVKARRAHHTAAHGQATDMAVAGFLTWRDVQHWPAQFACTLGVIRPWYGLRWALRPLRARLLRGREPASFALIVLTKPDPNPEPEPEPEHGHGG